MKNFAKKFIIGLDPSGNWHEGKGTTGWCVFNAADDKVIKVGELTAAEYDSAERYWNAHLELLASLLCKYDADNTVVVIEDYLLYANRATAQTNSRMETPQLIGVLKHYCWTWHIPYILQTASEVKKRWTNDILAYKHYVKEDTRGFYIPGNSKRVSRHTLDSIRHVVHYASFKNQK